MPYKTNKFKTSTSTWNKEIDLPNGLHSVSDIQRGKVTNHSVRI